MTGRDIASKEGLVRGGLLVLSSRIVVAGASFIANVLLTRLLGPEEVGAYFLVMTSVGFGALLAQLGLGPVVVRKLSVAFAVDARDQIWAIVRRTVLISGWSAVAVAVVYYLGLTSVVASAVFESEAVAQAAGIAALALFMSSALTIQTEIFRGLHRMIFYAAFGSLFYVVYASSLAFTWGIGRAVRLNDVILIVAATYGLVLLASSYRLSRVVPAGAERRDRQSGAGVLLAIAWPFLLTGSVNYLMGQADIWIAGYLFPEGHTAIYAVASRMAVLMAFPLLITNVVLAPAIAQLHVQQRKEYAEKIVRYSASLALIPALILFVVYAFAGDWLLRLVFGPYYVAAHTTLVILGVGQLTNIWTGACGNVLAMTGHERILMRILLMTILITVSMAMLLGRHFGLNGIATGFAFGLILQNLSLWWVTHRRVGIWTHATTRAHPVELVRVLISKG